jgi:hypothetical protein
MLAGPAQQVSDAVGAEPRVDVLHEHPGVKPRKVTPVL